MVAIDPIYHATQLTPLLFARIPESFCIIAKSSKEPPPFGYAVFSRVSTTTTVLGRGSVHVLGYQQVFDGTIKLALVNFSTLHHTLSVFPGNKKPTE